MEIHEENKEKGIDKYSSKLLYLSAILVVFGLLSLIFILDFATSFSKTESFASFDQMKYDKEAERLSKMEELDSYWKVPEIYLIKDSAYKQQVIYGQELIMHTSRYLGPNGSVANLSNGMNCQNCHLDGGTKIWGNNYAGVASTYPKVRARSGQMEGIEKRVNDCFERSLNGRALKDDSKEMTSIVAYIKFLGKHVAKDSVPQGTGIYDLPFLSRAADPSKGSTVYSTQCASCHGASGEGMMAQNQMEYTYPPLWGPNSYNSGAGLFRLSRLAGYVKYNMPYGASYLNPQISDEDAWDVAAYINSQPRPSKDISKDWPKIAKKPIDHPFGPFSDGFTEIQHKFGPFGPIAAEKKKKK